MNKNTRTLGVDDHIRETLKEPDRYAFSEPSDERFTFGISPEDLTISQLNRMTDAGLEGRLTYYEREHAFARDQNTKRQASIEVSRTKAEIALRKNNRCTDAVIAALVAPMGRPTPEAVNDAEANWQRVTRRAA